MKKFLKRQREKLKHFYHQKKLKHHDFSLISNNCWGTRVYQRFGLAYASPFQSLFLMADDYLTLLDGFCEEKLVLQKFITREESKYKEYIYNDKELYELNYPIGVLIGGEELHFQHYTSKEYAQEKWEKRVKRINWEKLLFKFSDGYLATQEHIKTFDKLPFEHKICFSAKPCEECSSVIYMDRFEDKEKVELEWKYDKYYINLHKVINNL